LVASARRLVIIGGSAVRSAENPIFQAFMRRAGTAARVGIIAYDAADPFFVEQQYKRVFEQLGAADVSILPVNSRDDANNAQVIGTVQNSDALFFPGGNQSSITGYIGGTELHSVLRRCVAEGMVLGGTSAGAAMMSETMIARGDDLRHSRSGIVETAPGMGFLHDLIIDQHFSQRGRYRRLIHAVVRNPQLLGLGIDENTAMVVDGDVFEVVGEGAVIVVDGSNLRFTNVPELHEEEGLAYGGVTVHGLQPGYRYDLGKREWLPKTNPPGKSDDV
jgi:cyanophycinase